MRNITDIFCFVLLTKILETFQSSVKYLFNVLTKAAIFSSSLSPDVTTLKIKNLQALLCHKCLEQILLEHSRSWIGINFAQGNKKITGGTPEVRSDKRFYLVDV